MADTEVSPETADARRPQHPGGTCAPVVRVVLVVLVAVLAGWQLWPRATPFASQPSSAADSDAIAAGGRLLELQDEWSQRLTERARRALAPAYAGHVVVAVSVELDPRIRSRAGVDVPAGGVQPNVVVAGRPVPEDAPMPLAADPNRAPAAASYVSKLRRSARSGTVETRTTDVALYGHRTESQLAPVLRRITASIVIDAASLPETDRDVAKAAIVEVVEHAIGFDAQRGDRIGDPAVVRFPVAPDPGAATGRMLPILMFAAAAIPLLVLFGWLGFRFGRRPRVLAPGSLSGSAESAADALPGPPTELGPEELAQRMRATIEAAIDADPSEVSRMFGDWAMEAPADGKPADGKPDGREAAGGKPAGGRAAAGATPARGPQA